MPEHIAIFDRYSTGTVCWQEGRWQRLPKRISRRQSCQMRQHSMTWLPSLNTSPHFLQRLEELNQKLAVVFAAIRSSAANSDCFARR